MNTIVLWLFVEMNNNRHIKWCKNVISSFWHTSRTNYEFLVHNLQFLIRIVFENHSVPIFLSRIKQLLYLFTIVFWVLFVIWFVSLHSSEKESQTFLWDVMKSQPWYQCTHSLNGLHVLNSFTGIWVISHFIYCKITL